MERFDLGVPCVILVFIYCINCIVDMDRSQVIESSGEGFEVEYKRGLDKMSSANSCEMAGSPQDIHALEAFAFLNHDRLGSAPESLSSHDNSREPCA
jgi:hypothetical protein